MSIPVNSQQTDAGSTTPISYLDITMRNYA